MNPDGGWTEVRYGRRRGNRPRRRQWTDGGRGPWRTDRAPPVPFGGQTFFPHPNWPVPPSGPPARYVGPHSLSYAAVTRGGNRFGAPNLQPRNNRVQYGQQPYQPPSDPKFGQLVRRLHSIIKVVHHLRNVSGMEDRDQPRMISRMVDTLGAMIKPAYPTEVTQDLIVGNAKNWGYNTMIILKDHYSDTLEGLMKDLSKDLGRDWKTAFEVATRWARKNLPRITQEVIDQAEALVVSSASEDLVVPEEMAQAVQDDGSRAPQPPPTVVQRAAQVTAEIQVVGQVRVPQSHSVATMTDMRPDWSSVSSSSPEDSDEEEDQEDSSPQTPVREQRVQRVAIPRPTLAVEDPLVDAGASPLFSMDSSPVQTPVPGSVNSWLENDQDPDQDKTPALVPVPHAEELLGAEETGAPAGRPSSQEDWLDMSGESLDPFGLVSTPVNVFTVRQHVHTERKMIVWGLHVEKKWLIIGDSNLTRFPAHSIRDLQIESYPGANFRHAQALLEKSITTSNLVVEKVVLSFGINSRAQLAKETAVKQLQGALRTAKRQFPYAEVWVPLINFSSTLPPRERESLDLLNQHIFRNMPYIPPLEDSRFRTEQDGVHWTSETAKEMLDYWVNYLNLQTR